MSQSGAAIDNPSLTDHESFTQAQLNQLFNTAGSEQTGYYPNIGEASENFDYKFDVETYFTPREFAAQSPNPAPNFSDHSFDQPYSRYPTPAPNTPCPHPIGEQQCFNSNITNPLPFRQRPQPLRSQTNTSYLQPSQPPPQYNRRRSLSQGDAEYHTASNNRVLQPTFMRLQAPRSRSATPDEHHQKRRAGPYRHSRSTSQGLNKRSCYPQDNTPTSVPYYVNGMIPTRIGIPLSPTSPRYHRPATHQQWPIQDRHPGGSAGDDVVFRHMAQPEEIERSRKIIEIGTLETRRQTDTAPHQRTETILQKIQEVENYLTTECRECEEALQACTTIKAALPVNPNIAHFAPEATTALGANLDAPSTVLAAQDRDFLGDATADGGLMAMLMREEDGDGSSGDSV